MSALWHVLVFQLIVGAILFGSAGRFDLPWFWAYLATATASMVIGYWAIDPELRKERGTSARRGEDPLVRLIAIPLILGQLVIAGLDAGRFAWSGEVHPAVHTVGLIGCALGSAFSYWAMACNRFFSPAVRIQSERGHHVVTDGPYHVVRHPGYAGLMVGIVMASLALGSWWSLIPAVALIAQFILRTAKEDRFLQAELAGYLQYCQAVRYRLLPGIW